MSENSKQGDKNPKPQTSSETEAYLAEQTVNRILRAAWRDFFEEQERKSGTAPTGE